MRIRYAAKTDLGMRRTHNEDCYGIVEDDALVLVADGMGGHAAGEIASGLAAVEVGSFYNRTHDRTPAAWPFECEPELNVLEKRLVCSFKLANQRIYEAAHSESGRRGMGTTLVAAAIVADQICIAHVGDSRAYRIRDDKIERLTRDHSLLEQFKEINPEMTREEEERFPHKNVITRALGLNDFVDVDVQTHALRAGDVYLLCSDGLSGHLDDEELLEVINGATNLERTVDELVERANDSGGNDNITLVMLKCSPD
ncbi:MAG TPA: Stp1/IreP family PP2C-type Ser/Thr phosphatase [Kofleriaceae bacterium]